MWGQFWCDHCHRAYHPDNEDFVCQGCGSAGIEIQDIVDFGDNEIISVIEKDVDEELNEEYLDLGCKRIRMVEERVIKLLEGGEIEIPKRASQDH